MSYQDLKIFSVKLSHREKKFRICKIFYGISSSMLKAMDLARSMASIEWDLDREYIDIEEVTHISDLDFLPTCNSGKDCIVCQPHDYRSQAVDSQ